MARKLRRIPPTNEPPRFIWELWRDPGQKYVPYFWEELTAQIMIFFLLLAVMGGLALLWPAPLDAPANTLVTPPGIKPDWYFDGLFQLIKLIPELAALILVAVVFVAMIVLPFVDRSPERNPLYKPVTTTVAVILVIAVLVLTVWGAVSG
jgi:quinol-cytochrome oxidoreductase complex cytochrome b subunit